MDSQDSACSAGDPALMPGSRRFPEEGNGQPLQNSCLENPLDRRAWQSTAQVVTKSQTPLSDSISHTSLGTPVTFYFSDSSYYLQGLFVGCLQAYLQYIFAVCPGGAGEVFRDRLMNKNELCKFLPALGVFAKWWGGGRKAGGMS